MPIERQGLGKLVESYKKNRKSDKSKVAPDQTTYTKDLLYHISENTTFQLLLGAMAFVVGASVLTRNYFCTREKQYSMNIKTTNPLTKAELLEAFRSPMNQPNPTNIQTDRLITRAMLCQIVSSDQNPAYQELILRPDPDIMSRSNN